MVAIARFFVVFAGLLTGFGVAAAVDRPERSEVIEEVAGFTGLSKDAVELVFKDSPSLLTSMDETVFAIKVVNKFSEAKDTEALADLYDYALGKALDKMKDKLLPQAMNGVLLAFSVYKTSLEAMRDYYYIPKFDNKIYQAYRSARLEDLRRGDTSFESKQTAFSQATTQKDSGYFVVKDQMYEKMIKAKGYNEIMGHVVEKKLRGQIDDFWRDRLELKLQQEQLRQRRQEMIAGVWKNRSAQVAAIRARAEQLSVPQEPVAKAKPRDSRSAPKDKAKPAPAKSGDGLKDIESALKNLGNELDKAFGESQPSKKSQSSAPSRPALSSGQKPKAPPPSIKSGEVVQSCAVCGPAGMDCECGSTTCVCCSRGQWCWPK